MPISMGKGYSGAILNSLLSACMIIGYSVYAIHAGEEQERWKDEVKEMKRCFVHSHACAGMHAHIKLEMRKAYSACTAVQAPKRVRFSLITNRRKEADLLPADYAIGKIC